ncbi:hypothetical protein ACWF7H_19440 [Peribacillus butanolivorans]|uniref:hypothetical protein n=1 Tax=Peribacillus butanolivorans TaxID=421767 RepID=UPI00367C6832
MNFSKLPQLVDMRGELKSKGMYSKRTKTITHRVWHHSLTKNICPDLMQQVSQITM